MECETIQAFALKKKKKETTKKTSFFYYSLVSSWEIIHLASGKLKIIFLIS